MFGVGDPLRVASVPVVAEASLDRRSAVTRRFNRRETIVLGDRPVPSLVSDESTFFEPVERGTDAPARYVGSLVNLGLGVS